MMLLDRMGLWVRDCPTLFVSAMSFKILGRSWPKRSFGCSPFSNEMCRQFWFSSGFIFSLRYVKITSSALTKKTAVSGQLFIVALTKATSLVSFFSDLYSYKVFAVLLNTDKDFKINYCKLCNFRSKDLVWWAICRQISEFTLLAPNPFIFSWGSTFFKRFSSFSTFMSLYTRFWKSFAIFSLRGGPLSSHFPKSC